MKRLLLVLIGFIALLFTANWSPVFAAPTTITKTCKFVLGDNDTKNEAREVSFVQCKRKVLEKAGSYIQSHVQVTNGKLSKEQVSTYAAAILSVEVIKEKFFFQGNSMVLEQTVKAMIDLEDVKKRLAAIVGDKSVAKKVENQQQRIKELESNVDDLRRELGSAKTTRAKAIRKQQNVVLEQIDELSKLKISIMQKIKAAENNVLKYVEVGMTRNEVLSLVGKYRGITEYYGKEWWNYGPKVWVGFNKAGLVSCISTQKTCRFVGSCSNCMVYKK